MSSRLEVSWNQDQIAWLLRNGMAKVALRVGRAAGRDALRKLRTGVRREIRLKKNLKVSRINKGLIPRLPRAARTLEDLQWSLVASGAPMPLAEYGARQLKSGVKFTVNKGSPKLIKSAFMARVGVGQHLGVFVRKGKQRLPIRELFSTRIKDVLFDTDVQPHVFDDARVEFRTTWARLLPHEIEKARKG